MTAAVAGAANEDPKATAEHPASRNAGALQASTPPVATNFADGNGPRMALIQSGVSRDAGKAFRKLQPPARAVATSVAVPTPGRCGIPADAARAMGSRSVAAATVNAAPASTAARN